MNDNDKDVIISKWLIIDRPGICDLVGWLKESDFFMAPCSTEFHLAVEGGLARHSWHVWYLLDEKIKRYGIDTDPDSAVVCGLGHDLCKANFYVRGTRNVKENGAWREKQVWQVKDKFPMGHGEKSVSILQDFIKLTEEEKLAIRWHMTGFDASIHFNYPNGYPFREAVKKFPLVTLLFTADYEASQIVEREGY